MSRHRLPLSMMSLIRTLAGTLLVLLSACSGRTQQQSTTAGNAPASAAQRAMSGVQQRYAIDGDATAITLTDEHEVVLSRVGEGGVSYEQEPLEKTRLDHGKFRMEGIVDWIGMASLSVKASEGTGYDAGTLLANVTIVLEPGTTRIVLRPSSEVVLDTIHGGKYSQALIESWLYDPAYAAASQKAEVLGGLDDSMTKAQQHKRIAEAQFYVDKASKVRATHLSSLLTSADPLMRFLALGNASDLEQLAALQKEMPDYPGVARAISGIHHEQKLIATDAAITPHKTIADFTAPDIGGRVFRLSEVFKQHRYVLVDFWASWCGPCREEIPHLKKAYAVFHPKGFEIVSFSLDNQESAWRRVSDEEKLPWINTSDLHAFSSPVAQLFGLRSIPASFLVDNEGRIVATSLWGKDLDKKLAALLRF